MESCDCHFVAVAITSSEALCFAGSGCFIATNITRLQFTSVWLDEILYELSI